MNNQFKEKWLRWTRRVYRPELTVLVFGIILSHYFLGNRSDVIVRALKTDWTSKMIFFIYSPIILLLAFFKPPELLTRLSRLILFVTTLFGIMTLEMAVFKSIHRFNIFDLIYHGFIIIQAAVILFHFITGVVQKLDIHEKLAVEVKPNPIMNLLLLLWVFAAFYLFKYWPGIKSYQAAEYTFLIGNLLIAAGVWLRSQKTKISKPSGYTKTYR